MRKLSDYLDRHQLTPTTFAERLGVAPSVITRLINGERGVSLETAVAIENATSGEIKPRDLLVEAS